MSLSDFWNPLSYPFWFIVLGVALTLAERLRPWRQQPLLRPQWRTDVLLATFNGLVLGHLLAWMIGVLHRTGVPEWSPTPLLSGLPWWGQFLLVLVVKDFGEWLVHNLLHRVSWLWQIHKLHHSITTMDWLGNMRFHPLEVVVYHTLLWLPLALVMVDWQVVLVLAVVGTFVGHLNHSNLRLDWGSLRYVFSSPRYHIWHHDADPAHPAGCNFAIIFSTWDWLFGTAHFPADREQPQALGFAGMERYPQTLPGRLLWPLPRITGSAP